MITLTFDKFLIVTGFQVMSNTTNVITQTSNKNINEKVVSRPMFDLGRNRSGGLAAVANQVWRRAFVLTPSDWLKSRSYRG